MYNNFSLPPLPQHQSGLQSHKISLWRVQSIIPPNALFLETGNLFQTLHVHMQKKKKKIAFFFCLPFLVYRPFFAPLPPPPPRFPVSSPPRHKRFPVKGAAIPTVKPKAGNDFLTPSILLQKLLPHQLHPFILERQGGGGEVPAPSDSLSSKASP